MAVSSHRMNVAPLQERGQKGRAIQAAGIPRARDTIGELLQHIQGAVMGSDDPVLTDHTLQRSELGFPPLLVARRVGRDVDVSAFVDKDGPPLEEASRLRVVSSRSNASATSSALACVRRSMSTHRSLEPFSRFGRCERLSRCSTPSRSKSMAVLTFCSAISARFYPAQCACETCAPCGPVVRAVTVCRPSRRARASETHGKGRECLWQFFLRSAASSGSSWSSFLSF